MTEDLASDADAAAAGVADQPRQAADRPRLPGSLHSRIIADLEGKILGGAWRPGDRIPYEHELTAFYGCSRMTVSKALAQLVRAGLLERRRKAGTFVTRPKVQSALLEIRDIASDVAALGLPYRFEALSRRVRRATAADRKRIETPLGAPLIAVVCRHDAGALPFCCEDRLISLAAVPAAADESFAAAPPGAWLSAEQPWTAAEHRIRAAGADRRVAKVLRVADGAPCLVVERRTWHAGQPVTQVTLTYPAGAHELVASFTPSRSA